MRPILLPLLVLLGLTVAGPCQAWDKIDPKEVRIITPNSATSDCIDQPKTPVCAVETVLACTRRIDKAMCARAGITRFHYQDKPEEKFRYRILSVKILSKKDIPKWQWEKPDGNRPGDVEVIVQEPDEHYSSFCPKSGCKFTYFVKSDGINWRVVDWYGWGYN